MPEIPILRGQKLTGKEGLLYMSDISEFIHFFPWHLLLLTLREKTLVYMDISSDSRGQLLRICQSFQKS